MQTEADIGVGSWRDCGSLGSPAGMPLAEGVLVAVGGGTGAWARLRTQRYASARFGVRGATWGITSINLAGSFALGFMTGGGVAGSSAALLCTGFCGGFTTASTASLQAHGHLAAGRLDLFVPHVAANALGCVVMVAAGMAAAQTPAGRACTRIGDRALGAAARRAGVL